MLEILEEYKSKINNNTKLLLKTELPQDSLIAKVVCNNNSLLMDDLERLFRDKKAESLPNTIVENLKHQISDIANLLDTIEQQTDKMNFVLQVLQKMDRLYAYCLQFSLITFGFKGKEEAQLIQNIRNKINEMEVDVIDLTTQTSINKKKIDEASQNLQDQLGELDKSSLEKIETKLNEFFKSSDVRSETLNQQAEKYKTEIDEKKKDATNLLNEISSHRDTAKQASESCNEHLKEISDIHSAGTQKLEEINTIATNANSQFQNAQDSASNANSSLQAATQHVAQIEAKVAAAAQHLANIKQRQEDVDEFYQNIESHKEEMLENKKQADADYSELKKKCIDTVADFTEKSKLIVKQNTEYQSEIKVLLQKAVGAGLFGVFGKRQKFLTITRFIWVALVFISAIALAIGIYKLASDLAKIKEVGWNVAFFVRTGIMIPLIYLLYFSAAQYKKERQAEEEYAFKSAISFSLEPYRGLLVKMRQDKAPETEFVKKLMEDIFDNPVKRLYTQKEEKTESEELMNILTSQFGKIPGEKKKILLEALQKIFGE